MATSNLQALELVIDRSEGGGKVSRELMKKKLRKAQREGRFMEIPKDPEWRFRICSANLMLGNYNWDGWEFRDPWATMLWLNPTALQKPRWEGQKGRVLILGEQGLGDEIMFASCIPEIQKTNEIGITCIPRLKSIFERNFGCPVYDRNEGKELTRARELLEDYDYYIGFGDLPRLLRRSRADFPGTPFLIPDRNLESQMEMYRGKVGISWRGRNGFYPLKDFPPGISLQYDLAWDEDPELPHIDVRNDMEGLLALVSVLEKVVCVSTTVTHFAGALGKKVEVILAPIQTARSKNQMNWRHGLNRPTSDWYKSALIYRNLDEWRRHHRIR
jgi:hypothetical protein